MLHRTSTHALVGLIAVALAVTGVFAFTHRQTAEAEAALEASATTLPPLLPEPNVPTRRLTLASFRPLPKPELSSVRLSPPIDRALERITKKPFGIEIHPETSPVPNDRFNGFHVGVDFETTEDEHGLEVPIYAVCDGRLLYAVRARGYGGVAVQACRIDGRDVSVIYGHLDLASVTYPAGTFLAAGTFVGVLGEGHSEETDGVRKHLHLGIRADSTEDIRGYVKSATETAQFVDILPYLR